MTRIALGVAAQILGALGLACIIPYAGAAIGDAMTSLFIAHHSGF